MLHRNKYIIVFVILFILNLFIHIFANAGPWDTEDYELGPWNTNPFKYSTYKYGSWDTESAEWYNSNWPYRLAVVIDHTKVAGDLTDFPIYVDLADLGTHFHSNVQADGDDIRVTKADGTTEVPYELVSLDTGAETGELHFKASGTLSSLVDTVFYIYYGYASATGYAITDTYGAENVWNSNYVMVQHMEDATTSTILDSTSNDNDGTKFATNEPVETSSGKIGSGQTFDGSNDLIDFGSNPLTGTAAFTLSAWCKTNVFDFDFGGSVFIGGPGSGTGAYIGVAYTVSGGGGTPETWGGGFYQGNYGSGNSDTDFVLLQFTFSGGVAGTAKIYANSSNTNTWSATPNIVSTYFRAGNVSPSYYLNGQVDEIRVLNTDLSQDWISTEFNNQSSPSTFYTVQGN